MLNKTILYITHYLHLVHWRREEKGIVSFSSWTVQPEDKAKTVGEKKKKNGQTVSNSLQQNTHIYTFPKTHCQEIGDQFAVKS